MNDRLPDLDSMELVGYFARPVPDRENPGEFVRRFAKAADDVSKIVQEAMCVDDPDLRDCLVGKIDRDATVLFDAVAARELRIVSWETSPRTELVQEILTFRGHLIRLVGMDDLGPSFSAILDGTLRASREKIGFLFSSPHR